MLAYVKLLLPTEVRMISKLLSNYDLEFCLRKLCHCNFSIAESLPTEQKEDRGLG